MKNLIIFTFFLAGAFNSIINAQNYNRIMTKAIKKAIGTDLKEYQTFSYPTDNFGLITSYQNSATDANFLCDMWNCIGINSSNIIDKTNWLSLNNFAAVGGGGSIELSNKDKSKIAIEVVLPKIYNVIGITGEFKKEKNTEITISIGKAYLRKLRRDEIIKYINNLDNSKSIKQNYINGSLVLIVADCVIEDMAVKVKVNQNMASNIDAKIGVSGTSTGAKIFQDSSLSVGVEKLSDGVYNFSISHPVIFARLAKKQPSAGALGENQDFSDWKTVKPIIDESKIKNRKK